MKKSVSQSNPAPTGQSHHNPRITEGALTALPVANGAEMLDEYAGHVWRRYHAPTEEVIDNPEHYLLTLYPDHRFAVAQPDADGARMIYSITDYEEAGPGFPADMRFDPDFFIIAPADDAKRETEFDRMNRQAADLAAKAERQERAYAKGAC